MIITDPQGKTYLDALIATAYKATTGPLDSLITEMKKGFQVVEDLPELMKTIATPASTSEMNAEAVSELKVSK